MWPLAFYLKSVSVASCPLKDESRQFAGLCYQWQQILLSCSKSREGDRQSSWKGYSTEWRISCLNKLPSTLVPKIPAKCYLRGRSLWPACDLVLVSMVRGSKAEPDLLHVWEITTGNSDCRRQWFIPCHLGLSQALPCEKRPSNLNPHYLMSTTREPTAQPCSQLCCPPSLGYNQWKSLSSGTAVSLQDITWACPEPAVLQFQVAVGTWLLWCICTWGKWFWFFFVKQLPDLAFLGGLLLKRTKRK